MASRSPTAIFVVLFLGPMYGGAALPTARSPAGPDAAGRRSSCSPQRSASSRRSGRPVPVNPDYARDHFQHPVHIGGIDISLYYLVTFVSGHVVASISIPYRGRGGVVASGRTNRGLADAACGSSASLYALATVVNHFGVKDEDGHGFQAAPHQVVAALGRSGLLVAAGLMWRRRPRDGRRCSAGLAAGPALGFVAYLLYLPGGERCLARLLPWR